MIIRWRLSELASHHITSGLKIIVGSKHPTRDQKAYLLNDQISCAYTLRIDHGDFQC